MNNTTNISYTVSITSGDYNPAEVYTYIALEIVIAILSLVGNGLVLMAIWKFRTLRTPTNWLVASLAVADIAVAIFAIPSAILLRLGLFVTHAECPYTVPGPSVGEVTCLLIISSVLFLTQVSIFSLTVIAIDRFIAINYPFKYQSLMTSKKFTKLCTAIVWILGALIGLAPQLGWNQWVQGDSLPCDRRRCAFEDVTNMEYMVYFNFFGCVLLPLLVMGIIYLIIFRSAKRQLRKIYFDVKSLRSRSRSVEFLQHLKVAKSEISINIQGRRRKYSQGKSPSHDDVTRSKFKMDNTDFKRLVKNNCNPNLADKSSTLEGANFNAEEYSNKSPEFLYGDPTNARTLVQSRSFSGDGRDNEYVVMPRQVQSSRQGRSSINGGDVEFSEKLCKDDGSRRKSSSFSVATAAAHPKSSKALILKKHHSLRPDVNPISTNSSRSTVYTQDFVTEKGGSNVTSNAELRRKMKRKKQMLKKEFRAARSLATVVGVFAICWLPLHIMNTFTLHCPTCYQPAWSTDLAILLSHANSMVNPFIYACSMQDYRKAFRKLLSFLGISCDSNSKCCCVVTSDEYGTPDTSSDDRSKDLDRGNTDTRNNNFNNSTAFPEEVYVKNERDALLQLKTNHDISNNAGSPQLSKAEPSEHLLEHNTPTHFTIKNEIQDSSILNGRNVNERILASKETMV